MPKRDVVIVLSFDDKGTAKVKQVTKVVKKELDKAMIDKGISSSEAKVPLLYMNLDVGGNTESQMKRIELSVEKLLEEVGKDCRDAFMHMLEVQKQIIKPN